MCRVHIEFKRSDIGLKIYTEFSNHFLSFYTQYADVKLGIKHITKFL